MNTVEGALDGTGLRVALVAARFNDVVVNQLVAGARDCLVRHGVAEDDLTLVRVPGAWELPVVVRALATAGEHDAIVALGCVVRGQTAHFECVAGEAARVGGVAADTGVPVGFGVLTTDTFEQAVDRAGGKLGNKGWEAALATLETADVLRRLGKAE